ncbi:hypothetical protein BPOR_0472g00030 [Botrytis porri]|uniref:Uncharacterized protein n=1 Tax=Botrytis porri TaxID=87229 RepID=A0A4Z1KKE7_9HELO|nr:hypothetical protein BPOR_0472g00030 [Botrytis porri]
MTELMIFEGDMGNSKGRQSNVEQKRREPDKDHLPRRCIGRRVAGDDGTRLCEAISASEEYDTSLNLADIDVVFRWEMQPLTLVGSVAASYHLKEDVDTIAV